MSSERETLAWGADTDFSGNVEERRNCSRIRPFRAPMYGTIVRSTPQPRDIFSNDRRALAVTEFQC